MKTPKNQFQVKKQSDDQLLNINKPNQYVIRFSGTSESKEAGEESARHKASIDSKNPVVVISNSFHYTPKVKLEDDLSYTVTLNGLPGGLARGVNSAFGSDSPYEQLKWFATTSEEVAINVGDRGQIYWPDANYELQQQINNKLNEEASEFLFLGNHQQKEWYSATNEVYWPLLHEMINYVIDVDKSDVYEEVNEAMANRVIQLIRENNNNIAKKPIVWVQDYHFNSSIKHFKEKAPDLQVGYFLHVPFPKIDEEMQQKLSTHIAGIKKSLKNLAKADSIGVHTERDKENFIQTLQNLGILSGEELKAMNDKVLVNPIGIPKTLVKDNLIKAMIAKTEERITFDDTKVNRENRKDNLPNRDGIAGDWIMIEGNIKPLKILNDEAKKWKNTDEKAKFSRGNMEFKKGKIHIGSLSRTDYTKGIHELILGFQKFLQEKRDGGMPNPEKSYQLNVISSAPRNLPAHLKYQEISLKLADNLLNEFPGSLNYIQGIPYDQIGLFFQAQQVIAATSIKDGYILSVGEGLIAKTSAALELLLPPHLIPSALIVSNTAGISESLKKNAFGEVDIPEALSLIEPTIDGVKNALAEQIARIETQMALPKNEQNMGGFYELADRLEDTAGFGKKALAHIVDRGNMDRASNTEHPSINIIAGAAVATLNQSAEDLSATSEAKLIPQLSSSLPETKRCFKAFAALAQSPCSTSLRNRNNSAPKPRSEEFRRKQSRSIG